MILHSILQPAILKQFRTIFLFSSHINKTYGSINKPIGQYGKDSKFTPTQQAIIDQKLQSKDDISENKNTKFSEQKISQQTQTKGERFDRFDQRKNKQMVFFFKLNQKQQLNTIEEFRQKQMLKELSIICRQMYFYKVQSETVWAAIENAFVYFLHPPYDQDKARSISQFLHGLAKSKRNTRNYAQEMIEVLPHCSIQSLTQTFVMILRMENQNQKFVTVVQDLYYKRKQEAGFKEICLINYSLAKCGRKIDTTIVQNVDKFQLREISLMLKAFDRSGNITQELLKKCSQLILTHKAEGLTFDLQHLMGIYLKHQYFDNFHLLHYFDEYFRQFSQVPGFISETFIESVWPYFPDAINKNKLPLSLIDGMLNKLGELKKNNRIKMRNWQYIEKSFSKIQNKDLRERFMKISEKK